MKHTTRKWLVSFVAIITAVAFAGACGSSTTSSQAGTGDSAIASDDFPTVGICATGSQDTASQTLIDALTAMASFTLLHLPYSSDSDIPFICGKQGNWDPSTTNALTPSGSGAITVATTIAAIFGGGFGSVFICNDGFGFTSGTTEGLHSANTWRGELTLTDGANNYQIRLRFTVSGNDTDKTLAQLGITAADLMLQDENGNVLTAVGDVLALLAANPSSVTINLVSGTTTHLTALGRTVCWEQI